MVLLVGEDRPALQQAVERDMGIGRVSDRVLCVIQKGYDEPQVSDSLKTFLRIHSWKKRERDLKSLRGQKHEMQQVWKRKTNVSLNVLYHFELDDLLCLLYRVKHKNVSLFQSLTCLLYGRNDCFRRLCLCV